TDNKALADGLKNGLTLISLFSKQAKDLLEMKAPAPDFSALDATLDLNQKRLQDLLATEKQDVVQTDALDAAKKRAAVGVGTFTGAMQKTFFTIQGGLSFYNLLRSSIGSLIRDANEATISENKLAFATREMEAAAPGATQRLMEYAAALRDKTGVDKDSIVTAEANLAATFKDEEAVKRLIPLIVDLVAFKKSQGDTTADLTNITNALTRAVNGEEGALTRMGVMLDESIVKSGDANAIVAELSRTYGGFAENTDANIRAQGVFNDKLEDVREALGILLSNALTPVLTPLGDLLTIVTKLPAPLQSATIFVAGLTVSMIALNTSLGGLPLLLGSLATGGVGLFGMFQGVSKGAGDAGRDVKAAKEELEAFRQFVDTLSPVIVELHIRDTEKEIEQIQKELDALGRFRSDAAIGSKILDALGFSDDEFEKKTNALERMKETLEVLKQATTKFDPVPTFTLTPKGDIKQTLAQIEAQVVALQEKRRDASKEEIGAINREIAALEQKKEALESIGTDAGVGSDVGALEKRLQLGEVSREQYEQELLQIRALAVEEKTRIEIDLKLKQSAASRMDERVKELDLQKQAGAISNATYITELQALGRTVTATEKKLEIQQKIAGAVGEQVKAEEEAEGRKNAIVIAGIQNRFDKQRAESAERLRVGLEIEQKIVDSATATDDQRRQAEENIRILKENNIKDLGEIDRQEALRAGEIRTDVEQKHFELALLLAETEHEANLLQIEEQFAEAEREARKLYTDKEQLELVLAALRKRKNQEIHQEEVRQLTRVLGLTAQLIGSVTTLADLFGAAGSQFVKEMQRALQIIQAIAAVITTINTIGKFFGLFSSGGFTGSGNPSEPAGVVHKEEIVFEEPIVRNNKDELLGLRRQLQKGKKLGEVVVSGSSEERAESVRKGFKQGGYTGVLGEILNSRPARIMDLMPGYQEGGFVPESAEWKRILEFIQGGAAPGGIQLPTTVINMIQQSTAGVSREELSVVVDELRRVNEKLTRLGESTDSLPDKMRLNLPEKIELEVDGSKLKQVIRFEERPKQ
ncbi:MAG: hypothetical protein ACKVRP_14640, partial [Bacteroidota bacterium]